MADGIVAPVFAACVIAFVSGECVDSTRYNGTLNVTVDGYTCQRWDSQHPNSHTTNTSKHFPNDASVHDAHNYCRNPLGLHEQLFCYTTDDSWAWDYCMNQTDTCQGPDIDQLDCFDLPDQQNSTNCPNDTVYYLCSFDSWSKGWLKHISYDLHCAQYQCCRNTTTDEEQSASTLTVFISSAVQERSTELSPNENTITPINEQREATTQPLSNCECLASDFNLYIFLPLMASFCYK